MTEWSNKSLQPMMTQQYSLAEQGGLDHFLVLHTEFTEN